MYHLHYQEPSPLTELRVDNADRIRFFVKRDDLLHPEISGNKWRKLKYNLQEASRLGYRKLLTFGGAYSNHLAATAAAGKSFGFDTVGLVRGERIEPLNPTLRFAEACGMKLRFASRASFRRKDRNELLHELDIDPAGYFILPDGGSNCFALKGTAELVEEVADQLGAVPDHICTAAGTGATMAGIVTAMRDRGKVTGISVLKGDFLKADVQGYLDQCGHGGPSKWEIRTEYHFGGYAKFKPPLIEFVNRFNERHGIPLDPIYTGKMFFAVFDLLEAGYFSEGSTVVLVHTGGLQGVEGFNERYGNLINV